MNSLLGFFMVLIIIGINGVLYYWACCCFMEIVDKLNDLSFRVFNVFFFMMSLGLAGSLTIGFFALVSIK